MGSHDGIVRDKIRSILGGGLLRALDTLLCHVQQFHDGSVLERCCRVDLGENDQERLRQVRGVRQYFENINNLTRTPTLEHRYNIDESELPTLGDSVADDSGWKLIHGDVFRHPRSLALYLSLIHI